MALIYLGFLESLRGILEALFKKILVPILKAIFESVFQLAFTLVKKLLWEVLIYFWKILLKMLDFLSDIFDIFSGTRYVLYYDGQQHINEVNQYMIQNGIQVLKDPKGAVVNYRQTYLLDLFWSSGPVSQAFLSISILAAAIAFLFTIYAVAASVSDMALDGKNPVGKVLGRGLKAALTFLMIPATVFIALQLSTIVLVEVSDSILNRNGTSVSGKPPTMGTIIFLSCSMNAGTESNPSFTDSRRAKYYTNGIGSYDLAQIKKDFTIENIDLVSGLTATILCMAIMLLALFMFVRRIIEVILLYIAAPFFVAAMPVDDGAMFRKWRDIFVGKLLSAFGTVFTMKLYLVFIPIISGSQLKLSTDATVDSLLKLFVIIGGAWAVYKSQHLILEIVSPEAAQTAGESGAAIAGLMMGGAGMLRGAISSAAGGMRGRSGGTGGYDSGGAGNGGSAFGGASGKASQSSAGNDEGAFRGTPGKASLSGTPASGG